MTTIERPTRIQGLRELRTAEVFPRLAFNIPRLAIQRRGEGEPVLVLPGFGASDTSTAILRSYLAYLGYDVRGWQLGTNRGNVEELLPRVIEKAHEYFNDCDVPLRLVGWSLGGYLAREVARDHPEIVDRVITLGSPVVGGPKYTAAAKVYEMNGFDLDAIEQSVEERYMVPIQVPITAIYSKHDGVVAWRACVDERSPNVDHIEVTSTHLGLGFDPTVFRLVAEHLAEEDDLSHSES